MFDGIKRGLQLIADFVRILLKGISEGNSELTAAAITVANAWLSEVSDAKGSLKGSVIVSLLFADPFANSRLLLKQLKAKYRL